MTSKDIHSLMRSGKFAHPCARPELKETHISWVILCDAHVYKIKKPLKYTFLDFSSVSKRKFYCEREVALNRRLTENMYLGIGIVTKSQGTFELSEDETNEKPALDYAIVMHRMDGAMQMDEMLRKNMVSTKDLEPLIGVLINFHKKAGIVNKQDLYSVQHNFDDLESHKTFIKNKLGDWSAALIDNAMEVSASFIHKHSALLQKRTKEGFVRDCHGDLHARNIFLYKKPVVFDCIEFNDEIRQIDILNELAFFCMDLEAMGFNELSKYFIKNYNLKYPVIRDRAEEKLFVYYKAYRANVRAKVNALRAKDCEGKEQEEALKSCNQYLELMDSYAQKLS